MKKKKVLLGLVIALLIMAVGVIAVSAQGVELTSTRDTTCFPTFGSPQCFDGFGIQPGASQSPAGGCTPSQTGYVAWDLTNINETINSAEVTFTTYNAVGVGANPVIFEIYEPAGPWTEGGDDPGPQTGNVVATHSQVIAGPGETVTFGGASAAAIGAYFEGKRGGEASLGIRISDGCSQSTIVSFDDQNGTGGQAAPQLQLGDPTAVAVDSFSANNNVSPVMGVGLLLVVVLLLGGFVAIRRRDSAV